MGKIYQVMVHGIKDEKVLIDLCNTDEQMQKMTVQQLKEKIMLKFPYFEGGEGMRLIFTNKELSGSATLLTSYGIQHMSHVFMIVKVPGGGLSA